MIIRKAIQAGRFYPDNPVELCQTIQDFLDKARIDAEVEHPKGLVVPHAGYIFSGLTAAHSYKLIQGKHYETVIIIAPSHRAQFMGGSVFEGDAYETPLGTIPIEKKIVSKLKEDKVITYCQQAHREEHSLEVQLPFLQMVLGDFKIVPILVYNQSYDNCRAISKAILKVLDDLKKQTTVVVASSDLYHNGSYERCKKVDAKLANELENFNAEGFIKGIEEQSYMACGHGPIATTMLISQSLGAKKAKILHRTNSYDAYPQSKSYVVGYLAAAFF